MWLVNCGNLVPVLYQEADLKAAVESWQPCLMEPWLGCIALGEQQMSDGKHGTQGIRMIVVLCRLLERQEDPT